MNKTMRKVVAFAATAAMAVSLIPSAFAAKESALLLIDDVRVNKDDVMFRDLTKYRDKVELQEMLDAIDAMSGSYNDTTNTFTITKRPSSVPYIRPYQFCDQMKKVDSLNYAPYMPLLVNLGFFDKNTQMYIPFSQMDSIEVDGVAYNIPEVPGVIGARYTEADLFWMLFGAYSDDTPNLKQSGAWYEAITNATGTSTLPAPANAAWPVWKDGKIDATKMANDEGGANLNYLYSVGVLKALGVTPSMQPEDMVDVLRIKAKADPRILAMREDLGKGYYDAIDSMIANFANSLYNNQTQVGNTVNAVNGLLDYVEKMSAAANKDSSVWKVLLGTATTPKDGSIYWAAHVFHNVRLTGNNTHTVKVVYKGATYTRTFTVAENIIAPYSLQQAKRIPGINYENMLANADSGNLFIQFSMRDLIMTDTWGTASSAFKLWDASNFTLSGTWLNFKSTVKQGDTVFFDVNATPINAKGEKVPAGTKLILKFSKQQYDGTIRTDYSYQYSNTYSAPVKDDNSFDFQLALNRSDMEWLFNGHYQRYVNVTFADADGKYEGAFDVTFSARDRVTTTVSFAEGARISMKVGETKNLNAVLTNAMSTKINTFVSSTPAVATVSKTGDLTATVTGVSLGTTVVTATTANGESAQIVVDVVADEPVITAKTYKVVTTSSALNVRSGAGTSYGIIGKLSKGSTFQGELNAAGDWVKLNYNGQTGYVSAKYVIAQ